MFFVLRLYLSVIELSGCVLCSSSLSLCNVNCLDVFFVLHLYLSVIELSDVFLVLNLYLSVM